MNLSSFKISTKVFALTLLLAGACGAVTATGVISLRDLSEASNAIRLAGEESLLGSHIEQHVMALNRAEFQIAADPSPENLAELREMISARLAAFSEGLAELEHLADPEQRALLAKVKVAFEPFQVNLDQTLAIAAEHGAEVETDGIRAEIIAEALASRDEAEALEHAIDAFVDYTMKMDAEIAAAAEAEYESRSLLMELVAGIGIAGAVALAWIISRYGIIGPIRSIIAGLQQLAKGNLGVAVVGLDRHDEIGDIAQTMQVFKENALAMERMRAEQAEAEARAEEEKRREMNALAGRFEASVGQIVQTLSSAVSEMESTARAMSATADETSAQATVVAAASEEATTNVHAVAGAAEELSSSIAEISRQVAQSSDIAANAVDEAERTNATVKGLAEAADRVGAVVELITQIASQTNLLALNATIEAARAGEAGKGFAVVASEVKTLATQTAKATEDITTQIASMQGATGGAVEAIGTISGVIGDLTSISTSIAGAVEQQDAATREIARNVQQASEGNREVAANIAGVNQAASETGAAAAQVLGAASELARQGETLRMEVDNFLEAVRAA